jgi:hypothetical protein
LRIFKNVAVFVSRSPEHFGSQLRRHLDPGHGSVFGHVANFVDLDVAPSGQRRFQLLRQLAGLVVSARKRAYKTRKVALCCVGRKMNAGDSGTGQELRETFFRRRCAQRHAIEHDLISRRAEQQPRISALIQGRA